MDVVYPVRPGPHNEELRFSLRSLQNLPHDRVWIVGGAPTWLRGVEWIEVPRARGQWEQSTANLLAAAEHPEVSEDFLWFNDDFFVMRPIASMPVLHRGSVAGPTKGATSYYRHLENLAAWLMSQGHERVLSYELHVPMVLNKTKVRAMASLGVPRADFVMHKRTLYGNVYDAGGSLMHDCKIRDKKARLDRLFLSTSDTSFLRWPVGQYIRERFPEPSPYEEASDAIPDERVAGRPRSHVPRDRGHREPERLAG